MLAIYNLHKDISYTACNICLICQLIYCLQYAIIYSQGKGKASNPLATLPNKLKGVIKMSDTNNKPAAEQKETEITLKELLNISDTITSLSINIEKTDFIFCAMENEFDEVSQINDNKKMLAKALTFDNVLKWCTVLDDYIFQLSNTIKALSTEYDEIYGKLRGVMQNG